MALFLTQNLFVAYGINLSNPAIASRLQSKRPERRVADMALIMSSAQSICVPVFAYGSSLQAVY